MAGPWPGCVSASSGGGLVLLDDAGGDAPAVTERDALVFGPRADTAAALTACRGPPGPAALSLPGLAGVADEGRELPPERGGVLGAQIDLVLCAAQPEPHRLIRRAAIQIVFEHDGYLRCHPGLLTTIGCLHRTDQPPAASPDAPPATPRIHGANASATYPAQPAVPWPASAGQYSVAGDAERVQTVWRSSS